MSIDSFLLLQLVVGLESRGIVVRCVVTSCSLQVFRLGL